MNRVVITGLGFITSIGNDKETVLNNLKSGRHGIELYSGFADDKIPVKCLGTIKGFKIDTVDPEDWEYPSRYSIRREVLRGFAPHCLYAYCAMAQAIEDAGLSEDEVSNKDTGMYTASAGSTVMLYNNMMKMDKMGIMRCPPLGVVSSVTGTLSYNLVSSYKIKGASCGFASACASSSHAMGFAFDEIVSGRQKRMFVVGGEDGDFRTVLPFAGMRALSLSKDPNNASRPFDKRRDGFVGTGGAVVMVLEEEGVARSRGAKVYGIISGWGQGSDGYNVAIPHPEGDGLSTAIDNAFRASGKCAEDIEYINAHGTSTPIGDIAELKGIEKAFCGKNSGVAISSTKALTGHGLSLAGVMEGAFCALCIEGNFMPISANISELDPFAEKFNILRETKYKGLRNVMSLSSGFGGANTAIIFESVR